MSNIVKLLIPAFVVFAGLMLYIQIDPRPEMGQTVEEIDLSQYKIKKSNAKKIKAKQQKKADTMAKQNLDYDSGTESMAGQESDDELDDDFFDEDIRPATEIYKTADEAFQSILRGVDDYDDIVIEQFAELDDSCTWCKSLYKQVSDRMLETDDLNEKAYLAEILSITGKKDNIDTLLLAYNTSDNPDHQESYLEALEYTVGDEDLVQYLAEKVNTDDNNLKTSVLAAISNHGSPMAIETIYNETINSNDPEGFYDLGIGLGEIIPDAESLPVLEKLAKQNDQYSHLSVKALLNYGDQGLERVFALLEAAPDDNTAKLLLRDQEEALDHVSFDENTEAIVKSKLYSSSGVVQEWAQLILDDMEFDDGEEQ